MFDIKWIRDNPDAFDAAMSRRKNVSVRSSDLIEIDERRRAAEGKDTSIAKLLAKGQTWTVSGTAADPV